MAASSCCSTSSSMTQCRRNFGPPCTIRCPMAIGGGSLESARSSLIWTIASRWSRMDTLPVASVLPRASRARKCRAPSPIESASPESSVSVRDAPTRYKPNFREDEPLFSVRMIVSLRDSVIALDLPLPVADLRHVVAMFADIELVALHRGPIEFHRLRDPMAESRNTAGRIERELEAVQVVQHDHIERRRGRAFLLVAADMDVVVIVSAVGELVDHRGVAVKRENHRLVGREQFVEVLVFHAVRMLRLGLQHHQIHDIDDADSDIGIVRPQQCDGGELSLIHIS